MNILCSFLIWGLVAVLQVLPHMKRMGNGGFLLPCRVTILEGPGAMMATHVVNRMAVGVPEVEGQLVVVMGTLGNVLACYFGVMIFR